MQIKGTGTGLLMGVLSLLSAGAVAAAETAATTEFTADAVITMPQRGVQSGTLYVSADGMRMDSLHQGRRVIEIRLPKEGIARIVFPDERTYMEMTLPPAGAGASMGPETVPCEPSDTLGCEKVATEQLGGTELEVWEVTPKGAPKPIRIWWDANRKMPMRQAMPNGSVMQAALQNTEDFGGRTVERWEISFRSPNGRYVTGTILYDPEYALSVYENMPGGMVRELRNIRPGKPDASLFDVPAGFSKIEPPQPPQGQMPQGQRMPQPPAGYGQPPAGYGQPPAGYGQPPAGYGQPPQMPAQ